MPFLSAWNTEDGLKPMPSSDALSGATFEVSGIFPLSTTQLEAKTALNMFALITYPLTTGLASSIKAPISFLFDNFLFTYLNYQHYQTELSSFSF